MSLFRRRILLPSLIVLALLVCAGPTFARVYVYEVVTDTNRFRTASMMSPVAFLKYQGGEDVIRELNIVKVYPGDDIDRVRKLHKLEATNEQQLSPRPPRGTHPSVPYIWWR